jgi:hypothetical protein
LSKATSQCTLLQTLTHHWDCKIKHKIQNINYYILKNCFSHIKLSLWSTITIVFYCVFLSINVYCMWKHVYINS